MVASSNYEQYSPFPRGVIPLELEGCQSSEEESELHSPFFDQPLTAFLPTEPRYQSIAPASILPPDSLIAPPHNSQYHAQSQGFGAHLDEYPKEPPNTAMTYNTSVQLRTQSFTSSAYELSMPHCFPSPMNPAFNRFTTSVDAPPSAHQITSSTSHFNLSHPSSSTASAPILQPPLTSPLALVDTVDPPKPAAPLGLPDASGASSSPRPGPARNVSSGVIACRQCRSRKIRCDSTRPKCQNCLKRGNDCVYDKVPKRRGPDKRPGTRKRSCKKRQSDGSEPNQPKKQRRGDPFDEDTTARADYKQNEISPMTLPVFVPAHHKVNKPETDPPAPTSSFVDDTPSFPDGYYVKRQPSPSSAKLASTSQLKSEISPDLPFSHPFESDLRSPETPSYDDPSPPPADDPVVNYARKAWWDDLLDTYALTREQALKDITNDLKVLFTSSGHWMTFFNVHWFLRNLFDTHARAHMQPALVYAYLAMAKFVRSSEIELGACGRVQALKLRDVAKAHLQESWNMQWIDLGLAEAAMVLALFETSAHPQHDDASADAALVLLDKIVETLQLTVLDARDHDTLEHSTGVPTVAHGHTLKRCECTAGPADGTSSWSYQPAWDPLWSAEEVRAEETRRLCWSALVLVANHTVARAAEQREPLCLFLIDSSNFQLLFPGEYNQRGEYPPAAAQSGKDSVWALYCRSMLLWNCTVRFWDERLPTEDRTRIACAAFVETRVVEEALDAHVCNIDTALIYMCREFISNTRLEVTYLTQRLLLDLDVRAKPVWNRRLAEEWLFYQEQVAKRVKNSLLTRHGAGDMAPTALANTTSPTAAHIFLRRPFEIGWFTNQVETCLALWEGDRGLLHALELAKTFLVPTEVLNALWPCAAFHARGKALRAQLSHACASSGIPPPPPSRALPLLPSLAPLLPSSNSGSTSSLDHMMGSSRP